MGTNGKLEFKAAQNMIDRYGDQALAEVDLRISELGKQEQLDAVELWKNIRKSVLFLLDAQAGKSVH